jgi:glyoxylase I family protein
MPYTAIDHPAIACYSTRKQIDWYCSVLGMRVIASNDQDPPTAIVGYDANAQGGAMIELMPVREDGPRPETFRRFQPGIRHIALRVKDFDAAFDQLKKAGVRFISDPIDAMGGGRIVSFRDPEGNELQIVQR